MRCFDNQRVAACPVITVACEQANPVVVPLGGPILLDLVNPSQHDEVLLSRASVCTAEKVLWAREPYRVHPAKRESAARGVT
jgi:hypothetical protein